MEIEVLGFWVLATLGGALLVKVVGSAMNLLWGYLWGYLWKKWRIRKDKPKTEFEDKLEKLEKLETELAKLHDENFNFRVARAIRRKLRERGRGLGN